MELYSTNQDCVKILVGNKVDRVSFMLSVYYNLDFWSPKKTKKILSNLNVDLHLKILGLRDDLHTSSFCWISEFESSIVKLQLTSALPEPFPFILAIFWNTRTLHLYMLLSNKDFPKSTSLCYMFFSFSSWWPQMLPMRSWQVL